MLDTLEDVLSMLQETSVRIEETSSESIDQSKILESLLLKQHGYVTDACRAALSCDSGLQGDTDGGGELPATVGLMMTGTRVEGVSATFTVLLGRSQAKTVG